MSFLLNEIVVGAARRARQLGFSLELLDLSKTNLSPTVLARILRTSGVIGVNPMSPE
jgi:hypothetical protein